MSKTETSSPETVRLNLFLAQVGVASRRACDEIIAGGKVKVNDRTTRRPGDRIVPGIDRVTVDGVAINRPARRVVLLMHKPTGVVCTASDPEGRMTVVDLCRKFGRGRRLFPVGRLDVTTTGALLITNDGLLCYRLTHPRFSIRRTYAVRVRGAFTEQKLRRLRRMASEGQRDEGRRPSVTLVKEGERETMLRMTLHEGRNRQVRRLCEAVGLRVVKLKRESFGPVSIRKLPLGAVRPLENKELERLDRIAGMGETNGHSKAGKVLPQGHRRVRTRRRPG